MTDNIAESSVQTRKDNYWKSTIMRLAAQYDIIPEWWSPARDAFFRGYWYQENFLASAIYAIANRNAAFGWELTGIEQDVDRSQQLLQFAEFGEGWQSLIIKTTIDLLTQDNGSFVEVIRPAKVKFENVTLPAYKILSETGKPEWFIDYNGKKEVLADTANIYDSPLDLPIGLAHLDAARCRRTGDSDIPVIYTDLNGKMHALKWWQVLMFNDMPSPIESMNGVGYCALSRLFRASHIMQSISIFNDEKVSGRFNRAVFLTNIDPDTINDAITQTEEDASNRGLIRYSQPIIAATLNPDAVPAVQTINLAEIPNGFDQDNTNSWYISALALALGVDYGFLAPLPGKGLGTASQSETMERQSKGKSSRLFMDMFSNAINFKGILPKSVQFRFTETDTEELERQEKERKARADRFKIYLETGLVTPTVAQQMLSDYGDIDVQYLEQMGQDDTTPIVTQQGDESLEAQSEQDDYSENYEQIEKRKKSLFKKPTLVKRLKNAAVKVFKTKQIATPKVDNPDLQIALDNYGDELEALTLQANNGEITQAQFEEQLSTFVETSLIALYSEMVGKDVTEFNAQDEANLEEYIVVNLESVKKLADNIYAGKYEDTEDKDGVLTLLGRLGLWIVNAYALATLADVFNPDNQEKRYEFILGNTREHCTDCSRLSGQVHTASDWASHSDLLPRSHSLECRGFNCLCMLQETDKPVSGNW